MRLLGCLAQGEKTPSTSRYEVYQATHRLIAAQQETQNWLAELGELVQPDPDKAEVRHNEKPLIRRRQSASDELG